MVLKVVSFILGISLALAQDSSDVFKKLEEVTVQIPHGTAFLFQGKSGRTYIITNWHVCNVSKWKNIVVVSKRSGETIQGQVWKSSPQADLCAAITTTRSKTLKLGASLVPGQEVYTRGFPFGILSQSKGRFLGSQSWDYLYSIEEVGECFPGSKKRRSYTGVVLGCEMSYNDNLTDLYSRPGSSGSPVVDANGDLVGVMSSWDGGKDAGGMVRLEDIRTFVEGL